MFRNINSQATIYPITVDMLNNKLAWNGEPAEKEDDEDMFERFCRICASIHEVGIKIFSDEGKTRLLPDKISKYLHVEVHLDDNLPKMICIQCCAHLDSIKDFAEMAKQSQVLLKTRIDAIIQTKQKLSENSSIEFVNVPEVDERALPIKLENIVNELRAQSEDDSQPSVTEMEVQIDPMMFLECGSGENSLLAEIGDDQQFTKELTKTAEILRENGVEIRKETKLVRPTKTLVFHKPLKRRKITYKEKPFECNYCSRSFLTDISLKNHLWVHGLKSISAISEKIMSTNSQFARDNNVNKVLPKREQPADNSDSEQNKYACKFCQRIFKTQQNLSKHMESHNTLTFECEVCARVYPTRSTLRAHSVSHSEARPHKCPVCKKTFKRTQDLKFHINQHTGERPYSCPYCKKTFASSGNCFSHRKRMHPMEVLRDKTRSYKKI